MSEQTLYDKSKTCHTNIVDFTDFQGIGSDSLYKRFASVTPTDGYVFKGCDTNPTDKIVSSDMLFTSQYEKKKKLVCNNLAKALEKFTWVFAASFATTFIGKLWWLS